jgi:hypothetical protein
MQQRRLRLGDVLDDYCPRERRVTNHAIVAMIDDDVKQTRCTTCDTEHQFKQGRMPTLRRKKDAVSTAYQEVLATVKAEAPLPATPSPSLAPPRDEIRAAVAGTETAPPPGPQSPGGQPLEAGNNGEGLERGPGDSDDADDSEEGRVHRRLIRATLPRQDNQPVVRPVPEFTMRQPIGRAGKFRAGVSRGPGAGPGGGGRGGGGNMNGNPRASVFGRPPGSRAGGVGQGGRVAGRNEGHRSPRAGQPARPGKKRPK